MDSMVSIGVLDVSLVLAENVCRATELGMRLAAYQRYKFIKRDAPTLVLVEGPQNVANVTLGKPFLR